MKRKAVAHRLEYLLTRGLEWAINALPERQADRVGGGIGGLIHQPLRIRSAVVVSNLRRAFPEASEEWIGATARGAYRHLGRETAATMRMAGLTREEIVASTEMVGWDDFAAAAAEGRGVVVMTGHFGNWEMAAAAVAARGIPVAAVVQPQSNALVNARIDANRNRLGVETIERAEASRLVPRALRNGYVVGLVSDQDAWESGVWVPFFGVPSSTHRGPALFALRHGAPVFTIAAYRLPGRVAYRVVLERVPVQRTGALADDILRLTADLAARLEAAVRLAPEQYFWFHRRWKTPLPAELSAASLGTIRTQTVGGQPDDESA